MTLNLGIDVSKAKLDAALLTLNGKYRSKVFVNDAAGFKSLLVWIKENVPAGMAGVHVCMEATGAYHEGLALFLSDQGIAVSVVNPLLVKRFMEVDRVRNKTDQGDAKCLARFCQTTQPELWEAPSVGVRTLQALVLRLDTLQEMRQSELNRLGVAHASVQQSIHDVIADLEHSIDAVRKQIQKAIDDDPILRRYDVRNYFDDIPLAAKTEDEFCELLEAILALGKSLTLKFNRDKSVFGVDSITHVGFVVRHNGVEVGKKDFLGG